MSETKRMDRSRRIRKAGALLLALVLSVSPVIAHADEPTTGAGATPQNEETTSSENPGPSSENAVPESATTEAPASSEESSESSQSEAAPESDPETSQSSSQEMPKENPPKPEPLTLSIVGANTIATDNDDMQIFLEANQIKKGTVFEVVVTLKNPMKEVISSPKVRLMLPNNAPYEPKEKDQTVAISLAPGEEVSLRFPMVARQNLTRGTYPVGLVLEEASIGANGTPSPKALQWNTSFSLLAKRSEMTKEQTELVQKLVDAWNAGKLKFVAEAEDKPKQPENNAQENTGDGGYMGESGYIGEAAGGTASGTDANVKNKPKLIISNYKVNPAMPKAGEDFTMDLVFYNTNSERSVRNIKITLNGAEQSSTAQGKPDQGSVFSPVNSSNTFYIDAIPPEESTSKTITLHTAPNATAQNYTMNVNFEYEDSDGNQFTATEIIGISVVQQAKILFGEIKPVEAFVGIPASIELDFYNTGKDTLSTFMVTTEGEGFVNSTPRYFVGNFAPGASDHYSAEIIPSKGGTIQGKVVVTYEDSTGQEQRKEVPFTVNVSEEMSPEGNNEMMIDPKTGFPIDPETGLPIDPQTGKPIGGSLLTNPLLWLAVAAVVAVVVGVILRRRKKKKENEELTLDA